jgi:hypothetical protein
MKGKTKHKLPRKAPDGSRIGHEHEPGGAESTPSSSRRRRRRHHHYCLTNPSERKKKEWREDEMEEEEMCNTLKFSYFRMLLVRIIKQQFEII